MRKRPHGLLVLAAATAAAWLPVLLASRTARAAGPLARTAMDAQEVDRIRALHPEAVDLLERGEALAAAGELEKADALFKQAGAAYPDGSLLWRRDCEVLTVLGRRDEAIAACNAANQNGHTNLNLRATLRALVVGPEPRPMDLFVALALTEDPRRKFARPDPILLGADCDIAESVGDANMLQQCARELQTIAPDDPSTHRAQQLLMAACPPGRFWFGWGAILGVVGATAWSAAGRRGWRSRSSAVRVLAASALTCAGLLASSGVAQADQPAAPAPIPAPKGALGKWAVDDDNPSASIPPEKERDADPLDFGYWVQDVIMKANHASKRGNHAAAAKFWVALGTAVPDRAISFARLCDEYEAVLDYPKAIEACGQALLRDGLTTHDYTHFVQVVLAQPGAVSPKQVSALSEVLAHMKTEDAGRAVVDDLECQVGVRTSNVAMLQECTTALRASAPDDPRTTSYLWALAMEKNDFTEAKRLIEQARARGVKVDALASMQRTTSEGARQYWKRILLWAATLALVVLAAWAAAKALAARRRTTLPA